MTYNSVTIGNASLYLGDSFSIMPTLNVASDAVICDPPFGITQCDWDYAIPLDSFWAMLEHRTKPSANIVLFGCGKFSINLINSKHRWYCYDLVWAKSKKVGFLNANLMPMRSHESIFVFNRPGFCKTATYNPQKTLGGSKPGVKTVSHQSNVYLNVGNYTRKSDGTVHPCSVLSFKSEAGYHPTQKPLALMEFLVRSYTNERDIVIDPFMGSGSTGVACMNTGRTFIGIERKQQYFDIACQRIERAHKGNVANIASIDELGNVEKNLPMSPRLPTFYTLGIWQS